MSIVIIGYGYVGKAMTKFFSNHYNVSVYDPLYDKSFCTQFGCNFITLEEANNYDLSIVCVPTPQSESGRCTTSIVEEVVDKVKTPLTIIKSTVEPGTTDRLKQKTGKRIVFAPEYCGESSYWSPYLWDREIKETPFFIFGGDPKDTSEAVDYYLPITGPVKTYRQTTAKSAEMSKYIENSFYATKITFAYEMACICKAANLDYNEVRELWLLDPRTNPMHTAVFSQNDNPFGGKCLPKDITALASWAKDVLGYNPEFLWEVLESNKRIGEHRKHR
jgi:UDPglucose 6-dehydrogenase